ncbi:MAG: hypothetical protein J6Y28_09625 [Acholeplasmatales bacterium]|nr:hypothetical protein [Methanobrevibacter sp.]MBP5446417.1 hypothetical protein [Acholeplasmatales bacterium]
MITIVVLNCSTSWCQSRVSKGGVEPDTIPSTGVLEQTDTVVAIPISFIKIANSKMVELKYEKEINSNLIEVVKNDSLVISGLEYELNNCLENKEVEVKRIRKQRNIFIATTIGAALVSLLVLLK